MGGVAELDLDFDLEPISGSWDLGVNQFVRILPEDGFWLLAGGIGQALFPWSVKGLRATS